MANMTLTPYFEIMEKAFSGSNLPFFGVLDHRMSVMQRRIKGGKGSCNIGPVAMGPQQVAFAGEKVEGKTGIGGFRYHQSVGVKSPFGRACCSRSIDDQCRIV